METFYRVSCAAMGILLAVALALTLIVGFTGNNPNGALAGRITVISMTAILAVFTVFAIVFMKVGGKTAYKIGFYILHCGIVVLAVGLIITNLASKSTYAEVSAEHVGKTFSTGVAAGDGSAALQFAHALRIESSEIEYYDEEKTSEKNYTAVIGVYDAAAERLIESKTVRMNHPVRIDGFKVYLMGVYPDGSVTLLFKTNPGEYVTLFGFAVTLAGITLACFSGVRRIRADKGEDGMKEKKRGEVKRRA